MASQQIPAVSRETTPGGLDSLLERIRQGVREIPIIVLSTLLESDTIVFLELRADDYLSRSFSSRESLARVSVAVRPRGRERGKLTLSMTGMLISATCS